MLTKDLGAKVAESTKIVYKNSRLTELAEKLKERGIIGLDLETVHRGNTIDPNNVDFIIGGSLAYPREGTFAQGFYVPCNHVTVEKQSFTLSPVKGADCFVDHVKRIAHQCTEKHLVEVFCDLLETPGLRIRGSHLKYDIVVLMHKSLEYRGVPLRVRATIEDSTLSSALLNYRQKGLKDRTLFDLGRKMLRFEEVCPDPKRAHQVPIPEMALYAGPDAAHVVDLVSKHIEIFGTDEKQHGNKLKLLQELEGPNVAVLATFEFNGVLIDVPYMHELTDRFRARVMEIELEVDSLAGMKIDIGSNHKLGNFMFNVACVWPTELSELNGNNHWKVDNGVLDTITRCKYVGERGRRLAELVKDHRKFSKLISTYTEVIPKKVDQHRRIHCSYNQTDVLTGRLSSSKPNLMNIPGRTEEGKEIRRTFTARDGFTLVGADYSQMELRILAHKTGCKELVKAFLNDNDVHQQTADAMGVDRKTAKTLNFGILYGMGPAKLAATLKLESIEEAKKLLAKYFAALPEIKAYKKWVKTFVEAHGYIHTLLKRTRSFKDAIARGDFWENAAGNTPIQGGAGDVIKVAQRNIYNWLLEKGWYQTKVFMLLQVHDELLFEVAEDIAEEFKAKLVELMENAVDLYVGKNRIPLKVDAKIGKTWLAVH